MAMTRVTATLCLLVGGGGVLAASAHDPAHQAVATEGGPARRVTPPTPATSTSSTTPSSTTATTATPTTTAAALPPTPPTRANGPIDEPEAPSPPADGGSGPVAGPPAGGLPDGGPETTVDRAGTYVLDLDTGGLVRLGDPGPFDVAGDRVVLASGMSVRSLAFDGTPVGGYDLPPAAPMLPGTTATGPEAITRIETAPDGTAVVLSFVPVTTSSGSTGASGMGRIVGPGGEVRRVDVPSSDFEWRDDGAAIAFGSHQQVHFLDATGRSIGNRATPSLYDLRWSPDGRSIAGSAQGPPVRVDVATGAVETLTALAGDVDLGPAGRIAGLARSDEVEWWEPVVVEPGGATTRLSTWPGAAGLTWSDGGALLAFVQSPAAPGSIGDGEVDDFLQVVDATGAPVHRVRPTATLTIQRGGFIAPAEPTWAGDRRIVFAVVAG
jgi:hypothetical protein